MKPQEDTSSLSRRFVSRRGRFLSIAAGVAIVLLTSVSFPALRAQSPSSLVFREGELVQVEVSWSRARHWRIVDDCGRVVRHGELEMGQRTLRLAGLPPGGYFLVWRSATESLQTETLATHTLCSFLILPVPPPVPEDHFLAISHPDMIDDARSGNSDYAFVFPAMKLLGIRRLRIEFAPPRLIGEDSDSIDWGPLDRIDRDAAEARVRLIAVLDADATDSPEAGNAGEAPDVPARALMHRYGFRLDEFALCSGIRMDALDDPTAKRILARMAPAYSTLKARFARCSVALGDLMPPYVSQPVAKSFLIESAQFCDVLDYRIPGTLGDARRATQDLDRLVEKTAWEKRHRAISDASVVTGTTESLATQRFQAVETIKKLVWARHLGYRYFVAAPLFDPEQSSTPTVSNVAMGPGFFSNPDVAQRVRSPRLVAGACAHAIMRLAGSRAAPRLAYRDDTMEIYGFERPGETVLVFWTPESGSGKAGKTAISLFWPVNASAEAYDLMGRRADHDRVRAKTEGEHYVLVDPDPAYLVVAARSDAIFW